MLAAIIISRVNCVQTANSVINFDERFRSFSQSDRSSDRPDDGMVTESARQNWWTLLAVIIMYLYTVPINLDLSFKYFYALYLAYNFCALFCN